MSDAICPLCPQSCRIAEGERGWCGARTTRNRVVMPTQYGLISSLALDPIEKKPLAFFHPGSMILSIGSLGCNLDCPFCQNSSIAHGWVDASQSESEQRTGRIRGVLSEDPSSEVEELVTLAKREVKRGSIGIAYTYNEPLINYEFVLESARLAHAEGLLNVIVTNAYLNKKPWDELLPHLDAANIDLKGFTQDFYDLVSAPRGLETVKRNIEQAAQSIHVEVTTLIIPGLNDTEAEIDALAAWLASIDPEIPLHLTRFFPQHRMLDRARTPVETLTRLREVASQHLARVMLGNI